MAQLMNSEKAALWRQRLRRFERSRLTVAGFCDQEGCSVPSFYAWRKKLADAKTRTTGHDRQPRQSASPFRPITVTPATPVSIWLAGGARIEVAAADVKLVRAVVREVLRADLAGEGDAAC
jgi:transposase